MRAIVILSVLTGVAGFLSIPAIAQQFQPTPSGRYTDVFAFCRAVKTTVPMFKPDKRYAGEDPPKAVVAAMKAQDVVWRCQDGELYGCETVQAAGDAGKLLASIPQTVQFGSSAVITQPRPWFRWLPITLLRIGYAKERHPLLIKPCILTLLISTGILTELGKKFRLNNGGNTRVSLPPLGHGQDS
jgi:hypothetical protein